jgi:small-conductance mechanosensitive channel
MTRVCRNATRALILLGVAACLAPGMFGQPHPDAAHQAPDATAPSTASEPAAETQAPIMVGDRVIFSIGRILSLPAATRAKLISGRITDLENDEFFNPDSLTVSEAEDTSDIVTGDLIVMSVTEHDARAAGMSRHDLALDYASRMASALKVTREERSPRRLAINVLYAAGCTIVLFALLWLSAAFFPRLYRKIESWSGKIVPRLRIQQFEILAADRAASLAVGVAKLVRLVLTLLLLYVYASLVLGLFPWTRGYAQALLSYVVNPLKLIGAALRSYLPNFFFIAVILTIAFFVIKGVKIFFAEIEKGTIRIKGFYPEWAQPTFNIARLCLFAVTAIVIFPYLPGSNSPAFRGVSIFVGLLFSFGSTSAVANVVSGVILTYMRAFHPGERVRIADTLGDVIEKNLLVTRLLTIKNEEVTIANAMVLGTQIVNYSAHAKSKGLILHTSVTIGYNAPWRKVHTLLIDAALATTDILREPRPFVWQTALSDFYVQYEINAYTAEANRMPEIYAELHANIQDKFNDGDVEIMSPHYTSLRDGNQVTIPETHLPENYVAPVFRVGLDQHIGASAPHAHAQAAPPTVEPGIER